MYSIDRCNASAVLLVPEQVPSRRGILHKVGPVEDRCIPPIPRHHPNLPVASLDIVQGLEYRENRVPVLDALGIDGLQQAFLIPARDLVVARMREIRMEPRLDLGEGLVVVAENGGCNTVRMSGEETLV